jgi:hypothetical protein
MGIIEEFANRFKTTVEDWEYWKKEHNSSEALIIANPDRIFGIIDISSIKGIEWKTYNKLTEPSKKMEGEFVYANKCFSVGFLRDLFPFIPETVEVAYYHLALLFKLTPDMALGLAERIITDDFYYDDEGVMFIDFEWEQKKDEWSTKTTDKEFIKWEGKMAKRLHKGKTYEFYEYIYKFEQFFEEQEEEGDMMLI